MPAEADHRSAWKVGEHAQRYRVGPNYLQLPINQPQKRVATNQRDGLMTVHVDRAPGQNAHVNYEPSSTGGLGEATPAGAPHAPHVQGSVQRTRIARTNDYRQAGERYRSIEPWERYDLVKNLIDQLLQCEPGVQEKRVWHFAQCDAGFIDRVADGLGMDESRRSPTGGPRGP